MAYITHTQAQIYKELIRRASENLTDEEISVAPLLLDEWEPYNDYIVGKRVQYLKKPYKVLQTHTSLPNWTPDVATSLFAEILNPNPYEIPEWVQPSSTNPYMMGDKVRHNGLIWISIADYNVWEPGVYGWEEYSE